MATRTNYPTQGRKKPQRKPKDAILPTLTTSTTPRKRTPQKTAAEKKQYVKEPIAKLSLHMQSQTKIKGQSRQPRQLESRKLYLNLCTPLAPSLKTSPPTNALQHLYRVLSALDHLPPPFIERRHKRAPASPATEIGPRILAQNNALAASLPHTICTHGRTSDMNNTHTVTEKNRSSAASSGAHAVARLAPEKWTSVQSAVPRVFDYALDVVSPPHTDPQRELEREFKVLHKLNHPEVNHREQATYHSSGADDLSKLIDPVLNVACYVCELLPLHRVVIFGTTNALVADTPQHRSTTPTNALHYW